eukprot:TRINITY_DN19932_c0_g1_i1.p1 TRINITY_DN19932_c0_g1~~TRINITY_DN19932_c0_g1_i1.p1  ORF type:complete len:1141 (-),score=286.60 TRINITY_DN19932_c0_g1_i1:29-3346(-)
MTAAYLIITFTHASSRKEKHDPYSFCFLKLTKASGAVVEDGEHRLPTYKYNKKGDDYLCMNPSDAQKLVMNQKEHTTVRTSLCSTVITNDEMLLKLLKWENLSDSELCTVLNEFTYVNQQEKIKFLAKIFDSLFKILSKKANDEKIRFLVYESLVRVLTAVISYKATDLQPMVDWYVREKFSSEEAHTILVHCMEFYLGKIKSDELIKLRTQIQDTIKCMRHIFKFVIESRLQYSRHHHASQVDPEFKGNLMKLFDALNVLMQQTSPDFLIGAQAIALKNYFMIFDDLLLLFPVGDLGRIAKDFIESINDNKPNLKLEKLELIRKVVAGGVYGGSESRRIILPTILGKLRLHIQGTKEEVTTCVLIVNTMLDAVQKGKGQEGDRQTLWDLLPLLPAIATALNGILSNEPSGRAECATCFLTMVHLLEKQEVDKLLQTILPKEGFTRQEFVALVLSVCKSLLNTPPYPDVWVVMQMFQFRNILKILHVFGAVVKKEFVKGVSFSKNIVESYFDVCLKLLTHPSLQLENFYMTKQSFVTSRYHDLRLDAIERVTEMWDAVGLKESLHLLSVMVARMLELTKSPHADLRATADKLYFQFLVREFEQTGDFREVERATVETIDKFVGDGQIDDALRAVFTRLEGTLKDDKTGQGLRRFVRHINQLMDLLATVNKYPKDSRYEDERTGAALKLMGYLKKTGSDTLYIHYLMDLRDLHDKLKNWVEAGVTLLTYANTLSWSEEPLVAVGSAFSHQTMRERKELLYKWAIQYFDEGKCWERGIQLCKELCYHYETETYNYKELSATLRSEANMFENIITTKRFYSNYFRVAYYGKFPSEYKNKEFVYRGYELERLADFMARVTEKFPQAEIIKTADTPGDDIINGDGMYIQITAVRPASEEQMQEKKCVVDKRKPEEVWKSDEQNDVNVFTYSRSFRKGEKVKGENEFKVLWVANVFLVTQEKFPNILRRADVVQKKEIVWSPIENAVHSIEQKNEDIKRVVMKFQSAGDQTGSTSELAMILNGVVDAAVNGGVYLYRDFMGKEYLEANQAFRPFARGLQQGLATQLQILDEGLTLHGRICTEDMRGLQNKLEEFYLRMKSDLEEDLNRKID